MYTEICNKTCKLANKKKKAKIYKIGEKILTRKPKATTQNISLSKRWQLKLKNSRK